MFRRRKCFYGYVNFQPSAPPVLSGEERFHGLDASVRDFWRFAMGDLRTNNVRGYLAEYFVARAVGATGGRVEWDAWDVTAPDGTKIEVKASGFLQAWDQSKLSSPSFRVAPSFGWDASAGDRSTEQLFHADVYVFCLHTATSHDEYDPLDTSQWLFYVASSEVIELRGGSRMGVSTLGVVVGEPVAYAELASAVAAETGS